LVKLALEPHGKRNLSLIVMGSDQQEAVMML
jgi:hypothetical protein